MCILSQSLKKLSETISKPESNVHHWLFFNNNLAGIEVQVVDNAAPELGSLAPWTCSNVFAVGKFNVILILDLLCVQVGSLLSVPGGPIFHMLSYLQVFHSCFWSLVDLLNLRTQTSQF